MVQINKILRNKEDILVIAAIFLLSLFFFKNIIGAGKVMNNGHYLHEQTFFIYNYKVALEHGTLPFWTPYWYSGQPLFGDGQVFFLNLTFMYMLLLRNIFLAIDLSTLTYFFIAGLGMYWLVKHLAESRSAAFISAIFYMFNGLIYTFITGGNPSILEPYSLIPLIFLCIVKAKKSKNPVNYSILAGTLLAFQIFSGGALIFIYTIVLILAYVGLDAIRTQFRTNFIKTLIILFVVSFVFFGLSAVKLLPGMEFIKKTNRAFGVSYQEYIGGDQFIFKDFFKTIVLNRASPSLKAHIGIIGFLLVLLSIRLWRKRIVFSMLLISAFTLLLASDSFLAKLFYDYFPAFAQTRHVGRVLFVFVFASSILAGYGFSYASEIALRRFRPIAGLKKIIFIAIVLLIFAELVFVKGLPEGLNISNQLKENQLAEYLGQQKGNFRITTFDVNDIVSFYGSSYYAQYGLETISGGGGVWFNDITSYIAIAKKYNNSKLLGLLNLKYATSTEIIDAPGFRLVKKFEECVSCNESGWTYWIDGPYLYENEDFLPRYYLVNNSLLILGDNNQAQQLIYGILLNKNFNPKTTTIIQGKHYSVSDYSIDFLKKFNAIILLKGSVDASSFRLLEQYKNSGGIIFPDILNNENAISMPEIESLLASFKSGLIEVESKTISPNEVELIPKNSGFLVLSERFSGFEDWHAESANKKFDILQANNIISAVYIDSAGPIKFKYLPKSFIKGVFISLSALLIIFIYALFFFLKKGIF